MSATAMNDTRNTSASYEVGYGKPPRRTQFRKGQSGTRAAGRGACRYGSRARCC